MTHNPAENVQGQLRRVPPYTSPCTDAIIFAISRPLNPSVCSATAFSAASSTSAETAIGVPFFPAAALAPLADAHRAE